MVEVLLGPSSFVFRGTFFKVLPSLSLICFRASSEPIAPSLLSSVSLAIAASLRSLYVVILSCFLGCFGLKAFNRGDGGVVGFPLCIHGYWLGLYMGKPRG